MRNCVILYKLKPLVLQNARSRRSVTGHSHTRNTEVERVHGHATANGVVIMADRVKDPVRKVGHAREVDHVREVNRVREVDHVTEADHVTETVMVHVDETGTDTEVIAEAEVTTVTDESVTLTVMSTKRSERGCPPRDWGKLIPNFNSQGFFCLTY